MSLSGSSVLSVSGLEVCGLTQISLAAGDPVGRPGDHLVGSDGGVAEKLMLFRRIVQVGGRSFFAGKDWLAAKMLAELFRDPADAESRARRDDPHRN